MRVYYCDQWKSFTQPNTSTSAPESVPASSSPKPVLTPKRKLASEVLNKLRVKRAELIKDKGGVEITSDPKATKGKVKFVIKEQGKLFVVKFHIVNRGESCVYFTYYTALHKMRCFTLVDKRRVRKILAYVVEVHYQVHHHGHFPANMYFEFCPEADPPVRELEAVVQTGLAETLGPESPYDPKQNRRLRPENRIVEVGVPPE
ncbi:hypothetical protein M9458_014306, partial [Cirrhinus mrigala]